MHLADRHHAGVRIDVDGDRDSSLVPMARACRDTGLGIDRGVVDGHGMGAQLRVAGGGNQLGDRRAARRGARRQLRQRDPAVGQPDSLGRRLERDRPRRLEPLPERLCRPAHCEGARPGAPARAGGRVERCHGRVRIDDPDRLRRHVQGPRGGLAEDRSQALAHVDEARSDLDRPVAQRRHDGFRARRRHRVLHREGHAGPSPHPGRVAGRRNLDRGRHAIQALQPVGVFDPLPGGEAVAGPDDVAAPELDGVIAQRPRDLVDLRLAGPRRLVRPESSERAGRRRNSCTP